MGTPQLATVVGRLIGEFDDQIQATSKCGVESASTVAGKYRNSIKRLNSLKKVIGLSVGEAIIGAADPRPG